MKLKKINENVMGKTTKKKSLKGAYGGGVPYHQMQVEKQFTKPEPHDGHKQKRNVEA